MDFNDQPPADNNAPFPPELTNNQGDNPKDRLLRSAGWLRGFRIDDIREPQVSAYQVASYVDGAAPFMEELTNLSTEIIITNTEHEANYAHRGWSIGAIRTISPWISSRLAANCQSNAARTGYTRLIKTRRLKMQVLLDDLVPVPEFEAAVEDALGKPTNFEKFQAVYRVLGRWGDIVPLEIEIGSSIALTGEDISHVQVCAPPEMGERNHGTIAWLSSVKNAAVTITGADLRLNYDQRTAIDGQDSQWQRITIGKVAPTISLLARDLQACISDLYAQRLSYVPPGGVGPIHYYYRTYGDDKYASKTMSSINIRSSDYIELLSVTYSDGTTSNNHGGGGHVGVVYEFPLAIGLQGEHIIEMLIWVQGDWLHGLQFITNMGRCSPQYGAHHGSPTIARTKGGVLVGFLSHTKLHPQYKEMFTGIQGIWRHDLVPIVPKEDDVYSEYFGARNSIGRIFNDRVLVGNSSSIHISGVEVWSGSLIDSIKFTYTDNKGSRELKSSSVRHGGPGGTFQRFELEDGEHIVRVSGRHEADQITQLCFATNRGRTSEVFGAGKGQSFSALAPRDDDGNYFRLQYIYGKSNSTSLTGVAFVWTPCYYELNHR
ncbi:unnamed protein product [Rhizoctonia solani]|uniref:Jacalin-type lectin domain-containing protein n=1 Tax=Rhizoctonia solani TaxID=456999 RepID=A0A8H3C4Z4_9AGAM|nr:unnamed protein product [Rhizoctonia solani]